MIEEQDNSSGANKEAGSNRAAVKGLLSVPLLAVIALALVAAVAVSGYLMWQPGNSQPPPPNPNNPVQVMDGSDKPVPSHTPIVAQVVPTKAPPTSTPLPTTPPTATALPSNTPLPSATATITPSNASTAPIDTPALPVPTQYTAPRPTSTPRPSTNTGGGTVASSGPGTPLRLRIPAIGVSAAVEKVGVASDGTMGIPSDEWDVGWYKQGYLPGANGNSVIDGHLDWTHGPAVFWNLAKLNIGDAIYVSDSKGVERKFLITNMVAYPYNNAPLNAIFGPANAAHLNLITCDGVFNHTTHNYNKRLVVFTTLASVAQQ